MATIQNRRMSFAKACLRGLITMHGRSPCRRAAMVRYPTELVLTLEIGPRQLSVSVVACHAVRSLRLLNVDHDRVPKLRLRCNRATCCCCLLMERAGCASPACCKAQPMPEFLLGMHPKCSEGWVAFHETSARPERDMGYGIWDWELMICWRLVRVVTCPA